MLFTIVHAQTTNSPQQIERPTESAKTKRGLYSYEDAFFGPPPPTLHHNQYIRPVSHPQYLNPTPTKWTNVFGFDDVTYESIFNELNGYNYGIQTHMTPPPPSVAPPSIFNNGFGYVNYRPPHDYESTYVSTDGRIVKQYAVHEKHHNDHPDPRPFKASPRVPSQYRPTQFTPNYFVPSNGPAAQPRALPLTDRNQIPTFLNKNHGPVALGSGSLGYITQPNGDIYLGSGSLGYITHKDHYDNVIEIVNRRQKAHPRGPTSFGHPHL